MNTAKVRIPATTANCGPGFDSIGIACSLYNELEVTELDTDTIEVEVIGEGKDTIPATWDNIICRAAANVFERVGHPKKGLRLKMHNRIPLARGLGSSAAAIVGGLFAANELSGKKLTEQELFEMATEMEGHPDNVAPAIFGGITVSIMEEGAPHYLRFLPPKPLHMVVAIPRFRLSTKKARSVLPDSVSRADAIFNLSRASLLVTALSQGKYEYLAYALEDKIHQPYRMPLIKGMEDVFAMAKEAGAIGSAISGAGPSLISFTDKDPKAVGEAMVAGFAKQDVKARYVMLRVAANGVEIV